MRESTARASGRSRLNWAGRGNRWEEKRKGQEMEKASRPREPMAKMTGLDRNQKLGLKRFREGASAGRSNGY